MKKLLCFIAALATFQQVQAAPNDTTTVVAHNETRLSWYENYDSTVVFPDGSVSYRKIVMEFNVGKYACDNYDPTRPGEGAGQTGWCADWDYDVHALAMTSAGDTFELGRLITPYANSTFISTPANWNQSYFFDVTDFYSILKDSVTVRIFYAGYSGGFTGTIKFHMIEGERARDVVGIKRMWANTYQYGNPALTINDAIEQDTVTVPLGTISADMKMIITGHGNATEGCAEFCRKYYRPVVNGVDDPATYIWRDDCGSNFLYPQSGTWIYNRANWCPGDQVQVNRHPIANSVLSQGSFTYDLDFQNYTANNTNDYPIYKVESVIFFYGAATQTVDAGLEYIISPTNNKYYNRENPVFKEAKVNVKNYGSTPITSITFRYGVNGVYAQAHYWTGTLASGDDADVLLPLNNLLAQAAANSEFNVKIEYVNNYPDGNIHNNDLSATFDGVPEWNGGKYSIEYKPAGVFNGNRQPIDYTIYDANDAVVITKSVAVAGSTLNTDEVSLPNGFYKLVVATPRGAGLSFFNYFTSGSFDVYDVSGARTKIAIPRNDLGNGGLKGNFGNGFTQNFRVVNSILSVDDAYVQNNFKVYPNPANDHVTLEWTLSGEAKVLVYNVVGQQVYQATTKDNKHQIQTSTWTKGLYHVHLIIDQQTVVKKIVID